MKPYYEKDGIVIYHGDCREILPTLEPVDLVLTDPPYCGVIGESWDNQWESEAHFLDWLMECLSLVRQTIAENGSLYVFTSPQMAARVEVSMREQFDILGSLVWDKGGGRKGAAGSGVDVTALRTYWSADTERCIFAGQYGSDQRAGEEAGYTKACEQAKVSVFGEYLEAEIVRSGVKRKEIAELFPSKTGNLTGCVSNWILGFNVPTSGQYQEIRLYLNAKGDEYLRREYEELRREYEELRRPFNLTAQHQWGDVLRFPIERERAHPTQKPLALIYQLVLVSSNTGQVILDPFMGSGTTLRAAKDLGRKAMGIEIEERYCEIAAKRLAQEVLL